jgi:hypothetical protein
MMVFGHPAGLRRSRPAIVAGVLPAASARHAFWGFVVVLVGFALISGSARGDAGAG